MHAVHVYISGTVQGVGYRQFVKHHAKRHSLVGWVKNLPDGRVEAFLQGEKEKVKHVLKVCENGPMLSQVKHVALQWEEPLTELTEFVIERD